MFYKIPCLLFLTFFLSFIDGLIVRLPEHQTELPDIVSIVAAMEANDLHAGWYVDTGPSSLVVAPPLPLLNLEAILIKEAHSIDTSFVVNHVDFNGCDFLIRRDIDDLWLKSGIAECIEGLGFDTVGESEHKLIEKGRCFEAETIQLDGLLTGNLCQILLLRPAEMVANLARWLTEGLGLAKFRLPGILGPISRD